MSIKTAILVYNGAAELDFVGPHEVFSISATIGHPEDQLYTVAKTDEIVVGLGGLKIVPDYTFATVPAPDILIVPGTQDPLAILGDKEMLDWVRKTDEKTQWTTSVCTGSFILLASGVAQGKKVTTHWMGIEPMKQMNLATVVEGTRYVQDGKIVTAAGITAGIDMALWLIGRIYGPDHARQVQEIMEYHPTPPYQS
ncbi:MAG TPA: DJ-1/PfpI family protein [Smithellaceae bacterium]|nr:DJ-1/PfpI family protein [Smithellaceae bacterium]